jgi:hypothetical protein
MAYIINKTNGKRLLVLQDAVVDTSTSLQLVGRNTVGYGEYENENFVFLLENFANSNPPSKPIEGQTWYDTEKNTLNAYTGQEWQLVGSPIFNNETPQNPLRGSLWFSEAIGSLSMWDGQSWIIIGPQAVVGFGETRNNSLTIKDIQGVQRPVILTVVDNTVISITSKDSFTISPTNTILGFDEIKSGINISNATKFYGDLVGLASESEKLKIGRQINGTVFNGTVNIETEYWGKSRNITVGNTTKVVNGAAPVAWTSAEIVNRNPPADIYSAWGDGVHLANPSYPDGIGSIVASLVFNSSRGMQLATSSIDENTPLKFRRINSSQPNGLGAWQSLVDETSTQSISGVKTFLSTIEGSISGNAATASALRTTVTIGGVLFNGAANINLPGVNISGNQNTTGSAASLTTARFVNDTKFDGTKNITTDKWGTARRLTIGNTGKLVNGKDDVAWSLNEIGVNDATLTLATSGIATGSQTWTANQGSTAKFTVNVPATNLGIIAGTVSGPEITISTGTPVTLPIATATNSGVVTTGNQTWSGTKTFNNTIIGSISGNAGTVTNGVYTTNDQTIGGTKTFSSAVILSTVGTSTNHAVRADRSISAGDGLSGGGNLTANRTLAVNSTVVRTSGDQIISGVKTFNNTIIGSISGNAGTVTNGVYTTNDQTIDGTKIFSSAVILSTAGTSTDHAVRADRSISAGDGLSGGGNLTANRTLAVNSTVVRTSGAQIISGVKTFSTALAVTGTDNAAGRFYAGTTNPSNTTRTNYDGHFHVNNLNAVGDVISASDERLKTNWKPVSSNFLENVSAVKSGSYDRIDTGIRQAGVSAQEWKKVLPETVVEDENGMLSVNYGAAALVSVIELAKEIKNLQNIINEQNRKSQYIFWWTQLKTFIQTFKKIPQNFMKRNW